MKTKIIFILFFFLLAVPAFSAETFKMADEGAPASDAAPREMATPVAPAKPVLKTWEDHYEDFTGERPFDAVREVGKQATAAAKSLGKALSNEIKNYQLQEKQRQMLTHFDQTFATLTQGLKLNADERAHLLLEVEKTYIDDFESGKNELDQVDFRDLPDIIQVEYGKIELSRTINGRVNTYYANGSVKTAWSMKNGQPDGPIVTYYPNNEIRFIDIYEDGRRLSRKKYDEEGKLVFEQNYSYEVTPQNNPAPVASSNPQISPAPQAAGSAPDSHG